MKKSLLLAVQALILAACGPSPENTPVSSAPTTPGTLVKLGMMTSDHVITREVQVWLPPGYDQTKDRYPVLYMHDGQNLFEAEFSYTGDEWGVDETMARLIAEQQIRAAIVVATHNTNATRWAEYAPQKVVKLWKPDAAEEAALQGDSFLRFVVEELKPRIDGEFRTLPEKPNTLVAGASMGGLISLYALAEYPDVFGGGAGLSIHWPIGDPTEDTTPAGTTPPAAKAMQDYLGSSGLDPVSQRFWFDRGTEGLDSFYGPYAESMQNWFESTFPDQRGNVVFHVYEGTDHKEEAWAARLHEPLMFLLGTEEMSE